MPVQRQDSRTGSRNGDACAFEPASCGPASLTQEGVWLAESMAQQHGAYNECIALRFNGRLVLAALEDALQTIVERHAALRTYFMEGPQGLMQQIRPTMTVALPPPAWLPADPQALADWIDGIAAGRFDLGGGPMFRFGLARLADDHHILVIAVHHIAVDGWSLGVFRRELCVLYASSVKSVPVELPEIRSSLIEYATRQRAFVASAAANQAAHFWHSQLTGRPQRPLLARRGGGDAAIHTPLIPAPSTIAAARLFARESKTSLFVVLLSAFAIALARITGEKDLVIATDFSDRQLPELEPMIGLLVNQLPLRLRLGQASSGAELTAVVHDACIGALAHKDLPYPMIARACRQGGAADAGFEAKFVLHSMPMPDYDLPGLRVEPIEVLSTQAKFGLLVELWEARGTLEGDMTVAAQYGDDRWLATLRAAFLDSLAQLLNRPTDSPWHSASIRPPVTGQAASAFVARPVPVVAVRSLVEVQRSDAPGRFPASIVAAHPKVDACAWFAESADSVKELLADAGAVLFRGFPITTAQQFLKLVESIDSETMDYVQRSTPRTAVIDKVYTSTEYPCDQEIFFHNENAYASVWPKRIAFWCETPPATGGRTPIADGRKVLGSIPAEIRDAFETYGLLYRRSFRPGLGIPWQETFGVVDRAELESRYAGQGYRFEWSDDGTLLAYFKAPAVIAHPDTGALSWFNHAALFHRAALPEMLRRHFETRDPAGMTMSTLLGNGAPIPDAWIVAIRGVYRQHAVRFDWQRGDILLLDNCITAHGREPYTPPRRILVSMTGSLRR